MGAQKPGVISFNFERTRLCGLFVRKFAKSLINKGGWRGVEGGANENRKIGAGKVGGGIGRLAGRPSVNIYFPEVVHHNLLLFFPTTFPVFRFKTNTRGFFCFSFGGRGHNFPPAARGVMPQNFLSVEITIIFLRAFSPLVTDETFILKCASYYIIFDYVI